MSRLKSAPAWRSTGSRADRPPRRGGCLGGVVSSASGGGWSDDVPVYGVFETIRDEVEYGLSDEGDCSQAVQAMPCTKYPPEAVESRGEEIYEQQIRPKVEAGNKGKFVVIDIETGEYDVDDDDLQATKRALAKRPEAILYGVRVGYPTAYTLGGHIAMEHLTSRR